MRKRSCGFTLMLRFEDIPAQFGPDYLLYPSKGMWEKFQALALAENSCKLNLKSPPRPVRLADRQTTRRHSWFMPPSVKMTTERGGWVWWHQEVARGHGSCSPRCLQNSHRHPSAWKGLITLLGTVNILLYSPKSQNQHFRVLTAHYWLKLK